MKTLELPDQQAVYYSIACDCGNKDHDMEVDFEWDDGIMEMFLYKTFYWKDYYVNYSWYFKIWKRISASLKLLFGGYVEMQGDILIMEEEHIDSFIEALQEGKRKIVEWKSANDSL
jgi:hypothetical protein